MSQTKSRETRIVSYLSGIACRERAWRKEAEGCSGPEADRSVDKLQFEMTEALEEIYAGG
jgi:hypothetical protein